LRIFNLFHRKQDPDRDDDHQKGKKSDAVTKNARTKRLLIRLTPLGNAHERVISSGKG